ncbi:MULTISPECIES: hypothetical protein [Hyphomicrobiales]|uniref:Uncharacterized protein n=2 Tax=Hyphomicrobiales TaxID=356 RepID=A0AAE7RD83_9HYPH|nr:MULTISPECIES: hypothetical protein [Hyphomicrobiales]AIK40950.1 hypothetical protein DR92_4516 [Brucella anthropi]KAB2744786.1 hypothetical protein F9K95_23265 [Brucella anthropi]KAB2789941.1 hypothetical protein F9L06_25175 [Brucella anthropi]MBN7807716.1 hypothetical protein [Agrobacterium rosae]NTE89597.1 hypothetical protein [Agrobacterium rubi]
MALSASLVHQTPSDARRRLAELNVSVEAVVRAVLAGHTARLNCTDNDPPFIPGTEAWRFVVRTLRDELLPLGWRKDDPSNYSLVINDSSQINIVVASSDAMTCMSHGSPRTKSLKGLYTEAAVLKNNLETDMFPETVEAELRKAATILSYPTWMLLIHIEDDVCRAELSLPSAFDERNVTSWEERIFIPLPDSNGGLPVEDPIDNPDIDVPVTRKVA